MHVIKFTSIYPSWPPSIFIIIRISSASESGEPESERISSCLGNHSITSWSACGRSLIPSLNKSIIACEIATSLIRKTEPRAIFHIFQTLGNCSRRSKEWLKELTKLTPSRNKELSILNQKWKNILKKCKVK